MDHQISHTERLELAIIAVAEACRVTRHVQQHLGDIRQQTKDDRSPVTVADYAAQAVIAKRLADKWGALLLVGEEDAASLRVTASATMREAVAAAAHIAWPEAGESDVLDAIDLGNHDASAEAYWTLDPIDGTKGFLRGGQYAVSLAYIEHGEVVLGVLGCPNLSSEMARSFDDPDPTGCLFFGSRDRGSWVIPVNGDPTSAVRVASAGTADITTMRICESVEAAHSRLDDTARIIEHLGATGQPARLDSQCKYAVVARGQADAYLRMPTQPGYVEKIWDHAAGKIIAEGAGAVVSDVHGHALDFSLGAGLSANRGVVCATPDCHLAILDAIKELGLYTE